MRVGFSGTRGGMTDEQRRAFIAWAKASGVTEFHHGCCIGADADAQEVMESADDLKFPRPRIVAHPPKNQSAMSALATMFADEIREPTEYLQRNRDIVDACEILTVCPKGPEEQRSGTWATVRFARRMGKPVVVVWPDGTVEREELTAW